MRYSILLLSVLFLFGCPGRQNIESENTRPDTSEQGHFNDEPDPDGSDEMTRAEFIKTEVNRIDSAHLLVKLFVYQSEAGNQDLILHLLESSRGERTLRKVSYEMLNEDFSFNVRYYYDLEGKIIYSELEKKGTAQDYSLHASIVYAYDGNVLEFRKEERIKGGTKTSAEFTESLFQDDFEGILHFPNAIDLMSGQGSKLVDKEFYIASREDYFDTGEGEIENADQPVTSASEKEFRRLDYRDIFLFIRENDQGQKVTWRSRASDNAPVFEIPLPAQTYFKGAWNNALIFEEQSKTDGFRLHVYDFTKKDFVFISKVSNMKITADRKYLVFTRTLTEEEVGFHPFCDAEPGAKGIGYMELIHLSEDYAELKYGQVFCFPLAR